MFKVAINNRIYLLALQDNTRLYPFDPDAVSTLYRVSDDFGHVSVYSITSPPFTVHYVDLFTTGSVVIKLCHTSDDPTIALNVLEQITLRTESKPPVHWNAGSCRLFVCPERTWRIPTFGKEHLGFWLIQFPTHYLQGFVPAYPFLTRLFVHSLQKKSYSLPYINSNEEIYAQYQKLMAARILEADIIPDRINLIINALIIETFSLIKKELTPVPRSSDPLKLLVFEAAAFIDQEYMNDLKIPLIARMLHTNTSTLTRRFHSVFGATVLDYITKRRLEAAVRMLIETADKEDAIAAACGYETAAWLINRFQKTFDCTPGFIRSHLNSPNREI